MKHLKTFERFVNESYNVNESRVAIQPMDKITGPDEKVIQLVGAEGVPVSYFWSNTKKGIVRSMQFAGNSEIELLVKCKEGSGDQLIAQATKDLGRKTWSDGMACSKELEKYFKDNLKTFESVINEGAGNTIASKYDAQFVSDIDMDEIDLGDVAKATLDKTLKTRQPYFYMTNKAFIEQEGKSWDALIQDVTSRNIVHLLIEDPETGDCVLLFAK